MSDEFSPCDFADEIVECPHEQRGTVEQRQKRNQRLEAAWRCPRAPTWPRLGGMTRWTNTTTNHSGRAYKEVAIKRNDRERLRGIELGVLGYNDRHRGHTRDGSRRQSRGRMRGIGVDQVRRPTERAYDSRGKTWAGTDRARGDVGCRADATIAEESMAAEAVQGEGSRD